jgi:hypothetical protein
MAADSLWQLYRMNDVGEWVAVAGLDSLAAVAKRIIAIEAIMARSLIFQMHVDAESTSDEDVHLEYQGRHGVYVIKRREG